MNSMTNRPSGFEHGSHYKLSAHEWMSSIPVIDTLTLGELVLPGAHNSGVDKKATYAFPGVVHWAACQNTPFYQQLLDGTRALDLRLEQDEQGNFWFQHSNFRSSRALEDLIMAVDRFLAGNPNEFLVLDFHELSSNSAPFNGHEFSRIIMTHLGKRIIPTDNSDLTLGELKRISPLQRVMVAAGGDLDRRYFNSKIEHQWSGIDDANVIELQGFITRVMQSPPRGSLPWSLSATSYNKAWGPVNIHEHLDRWFDPRRNYWVLKCSIINADFIEQSDLVLLCRTANLMKVNAR